MNNATRWILLIALVSLIGACERMSGTVHQQSPPASAGAPSDAPPTHEATTQPESETQPTTMPVDPHTNVDVEEVTLDDLGVRLTVPTALEMTREGNTAVFTTEGFYPVTVSVEPLTLENAFFKVSVDGVEQLASGTTRDGGARVVQSDCLLIRCAVERPSRPDRLISDIADLICESVEAIPPPTRGVLQRVRDSGQSFSGQCDESDRALAATYSEAVRVESLQNAVAECWSQAAVANPAWAASEPRFTVGWDVRREEAPAFRTALDGLEGDTSALSACLAAAVEPLRTQLPQDARSSEGCAGMSSTATYDLGHRAVCPQ